MGYLPEGFRFKGGQQLQALKQSPSKRGNLLKLFNLRILGDPLRKAGKRGLFKTAPLNYYIVNLQVHSVSPT